MTSRTSEETSVWYFVGATFIFVMPGLFFRDLDSPWLSLSTIAVGLVVLALGFRVMAREREAARAASSATSTDDGAAGDRDTDGQSLDDHGPQS